MRVGIHQINYFPWLGYFNKIAKSDIFILMDEVQLSDSGTMQRNRILNKMGQLSYITVAFVKKDYMNKKFNEIQLNAQVDWKKRQMNFLKDTYGKFPYWEEVWEKISPIFENEFKTLMEVNVCALYTILNLLEIKTPLIFQSQLNYCHDVKKSDLVLSLCSAANADIYLSGTGAKKYMDVEKFHKENIQVQFQTYEFPIYEQKYASDFIPGLSVLDILLNCGIAKTKELFWNNMYLEEKSI